MTFVPFNPDETRKVGAFVEALNAVEGKFGMSLDLGPITTSSPVLIVGTAEKYAVVRDSIDGDLRPAMEMK